MWTVDTTCIRIRSWFVTTFFKKVQYELMMITSMGLQSLWFFYTACIFILFSSPMTQHMHSQKSSTWSRLFSVLRDIEAVGDEYLWSKFPLQIPENVKQFLVKILPYIVIVWLLAMLPAILALLGIGALMGSVAWFLAIFVLLASIMMVWVFVLLAMSIKPLFAHAKKGWDYLFWAQLLHFVSAMIGGAVMSAVIAGFIWFYLLFQVKKYYK